MNKHLLIAVLLICATLQNVLAVDKDKAEIYSRFAKAASSFTSPDGWKFHEAVGVTKDEYGSIGVKRGGTATAIVGYHLKQNEVVVAFGAPLRHCGLAWSSELKAVQGPIKVHKSIYRLYEDLNQDIDSSAADPSLWGLVREAVRKIAARYATQGQFRTLYTEYKFNIIFTGHGLGGALATLAGALFEVKLKDEKSPELSAGEPTYQVYTFGSPRVGNKEFVKLYRTRVQDSYRIAYDNDPLVGFPAKSTDGYWHVPTKIQYTSLADNKFESSEDDSGTPVPPTSDPLKYFALEITHAGEIQSDACLKPKTMETERDQGKKSGNPDKDALKKSGSVAKDTSKQGNGKGNGNSKPDSGKPGKL